MKMLITPIFVLLSTPAFAGGVSVTVNPQTPIVRTSDITVVGQEVHGPWFSAQYVIKNETNQTVTVDYIQERIDSKDGQSSGWATSIGPVELAPGASYTTEVKYTDGLPTSTDMNFTVTAELSGWAGTKAAPGEQLDHPFVFQTQ